MRQTAILGALVLAGMGLGSTAWADGRLDGPYIGIQGTREHLTIKYDEIYDDGIDSGSLHFDGLGTSGFSGGIFAGYDVNVNGSHFAVEGEYGTGSTELNVDLTLNGDAFLASAEARYTYGASLRYGYEVVDNTMFYIRAGWIRTKFKDSDGFSSNLDGLRFGAGVEMGLSKRVSLRLEYVYTDYENLEIIDIDDVAVLSPSSGAVNLGLAVRF